ncbi:nitroreductase/quinone reductase family protein [Cellulomonas sp. URHE0023]|uniref:nitroreductase/quinone reductase family protein n=1 Tax=Cellulomonas sp. URHE0023 TaxID=1380354 RepID=UPI00047F2968|nr:nitroreductase/quinone reductase family protein [Cellulomonas sp. URHE0023]
MPLPLWVTRVNRRVANPLLSLLSDDVPPLATLHHVGRSSGRRFRTPVMAFPSGSRVTIALTYGPRVQWLRNIEAGRPARLVRRRTVLALSDPVRLRGAEGARLVPAWTRAALRLLGTDEFVSLRADDPYDRPQEVPDAA